MIEIKHKNSGFVIYTHAGDSLAGARLINADFTGAGLTNAIFTGANLIGADFTGARLINADFTGAGLIGADFIGANLTDADFPGANLTDADFTGAGLTNAIFTGANLICADFTGARLTDADFTGADLRWCVGDGRVIRSKYFGPYHVVSCKKTLCIGCQSHSVNVWRRFSDAKIDKMAPGYSLKWWVKYRDDVLAFADGQ
jgi:hypothetical protein